MAGLSATAMFSIVSLLAIRAEETAPTTAPGGVVATAAATLPPKQVVIYVTDAPRSRRPGRAG